MRQMVQRAKRIAYKDYFSRLRHAVECSFVHVVRWTEKKPSLPAWSGT